MSLTKVLEILGYMSAPVVVDFALNGEVCKHVTMWYDYVPLSDLLGVPHQFSVQ
jgi:hypothetical protein